MDGDALYEIGELARRTGLTVKAIRFYSDRGIVPPVDRSPAGYRRYDDDALARLDLVRTLRDLGLDLATIRKVVDREISLPEVAAAHAEALTVQIRVLRLQRAVLTVVAKRGSTPKELELMHTFAKLSALERQRLIDDFLDSAFGGLGAGDEWAGIARSMTPELPDNPEPEQVEAWVELAELSQDPEFRANMRKVAEHHAADRAQSGTTRPRRDAVAIVRDLVIPALAAGIQPSATEADPVVESVMAEYARLAGIADGVELRQRMLTRLETANDRRRERYFELLSVINGWTRPESAAPAIGWFIDAAFARGAR